MPHLNTRFNAQLLQNGCQHILGTEILHPQLTWGTREVPKGRPMNKKELLNRIITRLSRDLQVLLDAARSAHEAATHEENIPDNKYDTLALEASYVAQGQANRAGEMRRSLELYRQLDDQRSGKSIHLASLVTLEDGDGITKTLFIGPSEGGLKIGMDGYEITVITPASPLGRELFGKSVGDAVELQTGAVCTVYEIVEVE